MKKFKSIIALTLSIIMLLSMTTYAAEGNDKELKEKNFYDTMNSLARENNFEILDADSIPESDFIKFDSMEEAEKFIKTLSKKQVLTESISVEKQVSDIQENSMLEGSVLAESKSTISSVYDDSHVISWWAPFSGWGMTGLACWRNVSFEYTYDFLNGNPRFLTISNIDSYLTGINVTWWQPKTTDDDIVTEVNPDDKVTFNIKGNYVLGVEVEGFTIGVKIPGEWDASLRLY